MPSFSYEKKLWEKGLICVAGADEVGRGAWSGPVVAAAVVFKSNSKFEARNTKLIRIDDSKKLSSTQRQRAEKWIKENALAWGIGEVPASKINKIGLTRASQMAFRRAVRECNNRLSSKKSSHSPNESWTMNKVKDPWVHPRTSYSQTGQTIDFLLLDAFYLPYVKSIPKRRQLAIIKGDSKSYSIAAASIIAKEYRDQKMKKLAERYPKYRWASNVGYGTKKHQEGILKIGISRFHRKVFLRKLFEKNS